MNINVFENFDKMSCEAAKLIISLINKKPESLITFANGNSPKGVFKYLLQAKDDGKVDLTKCKFVILDNFVGISKEDEDVLYSSLNEEFFKIAGILPEQIYDFETRTSDLNVECKRIDDIIFEHGSLDIILLGIGMNGHLGFNEPGSSFNSYTHIIDLDETTQKVGQQYFKHSVSISKGITLGIKHILESKVAIGIADGTKKANIVQKWFEGSITEEMPCSALNLHSNAYVFLDKEAYAKINDKK